MVVRNGRDDTVSVLLEGLAPLDSTRGALDGHGSAPAVAVPAAAVVAAVGWLLHVIHNSIVLFCWDESRQR